MNFDGNTHPSYNQEWPGVVNQWDDVQDENEPWWVAATRLLQDDKGGKGGKSESQVDYSALSVAVMTLGLIMMVEVIRHRVDHAAVGRPFFQSVLETLYMERK